MRILLTLALSAATLSSAVAANFTLYPGFRDRDALIEAATDKGLIVEIILRCERTPSGKIKSGIMTYSKVENLYCSSKNRCYRDAEKAFDDTCY